MKWLIVFVVFVFGVVCAQDAQAPDAEYEPEPEPNGPPNCLDDSHCNGGTCHWDGTCRCPSNKYGDNCETMNELRCLVCDGYVHGMSNCFTGVGVDLERDVMTCDRDQHYCKSEVWFGEDGVPWLKRHGCSRNCWQKEGCRPNSRESCVACCDYDYCIGGEQLMIGGAKVITSSIALISLLSIFSYMI